MSIKIKDSYLPYMITRCVPSECMVVKRINLENILGPVFCNMWGKYFISAFLCWRMLSVYILFMYVIDTNESKVVWSNWVGTNVRFPLSKNTFRDEDEIRLESKAENSFALCRTYGQMYFAVHSPDPIYSRLW
jgi:hypothetical protein